jgi:hypothetical protein
MDESKHDSITRRSGFFNNKPGRFILEIFIRFGTYPKQIGTVIDKLELKPIVLATEMLMTYSLRALIQR